MRSTVRGAEHAGFFNVKNLENARDIYKRQYLAPEQILEDVQKTGSEVPQ